MNMFDKLNQFPVQVPVAKTEENPIQSSIEKKPRPGEMLKSYKKALWEKTKAIFLKLGVTLEGESGIALEKVAVAGIKEMKNNSEDFRFLDTPYYQDGNEFVLRQVGAIDPKHNPEKAPVYEPWKLTEQQEGERALNREILILENLDDFTDGETVSADTQVKANRSYQAGPLFLAKEIRNQERALEKYGEEEGRALAKTLLRLQTNVRATEMINKIMIQDGIADKRDLENKIFEDYFDDFDGYMDNSAPILEDLDNKKLATRLKKKMEAFRETIENEQLVEEEYSLVHGNVNFDTIKFSNEGGAYLSDWQKAGETQNPPLSLVYDLGTAFQEAVEKFDDLSQIEAFIGGIETEIRNFYNEKGKPELAEAVIGLTKLRSFAEIVNDQEGEKKKFVLRALGEK